MRAAQRFALRVKAVSASSACFRTRLGSAPMPSGNSTQGGNPSARRAQTSAPDRAAQRATPTQTQLDRLHDVAPPEGAHFTASLEWTSTGMLRGVVESGDARLLATGSPKNP